MLWRKALFIALIIFCLTPWGSPPIALALGLVLAFTLGNPFPEVEGKVTKYLLQVSVVLLGFGMNLKAVYDAGREGILFTIATIFGTLILGYFVGRLLKIEHRTSALISTGTAICGGSAIAAVAPAIEAEPDQISLSLGTVFVLNSVALFLFPVIGHVVGLSQHQFGVWSAIAIHDTSSVVGASASYGAEALAIATTVKLARALWIAPVALMFALLYRKRNQGPRAKIAIPWFILFFLLATAFRSYAPSIVLPSIFDAIVNLAKAGLTVTLFFIGVSLSRETLSKFGWTALLQGVILWVVISLVSLWAVTSLV
ncbi:MAG TPA: putative sulfate exporter family transporter [Pyrinomonadaceae bacterium]|nr:putative sulfate exporter family transporter [Pyrinomonadaceae bacterium]